MFSEMALPAVPELSVLCTPGMRRMMSPMALAPLFSMTCLSTMLRAPAKVRALCCRPEPSQSPGDLDGVQRHRAVGGADLGVRVGNPKQGECDGADGGSREGRPTVGVRVHAGRSFFIILNKNTNDKYCQYLVQTQGLRDANGLLRRASGCVLDHQLRGDHAVPEILVQPVGGLDAVGQRRGQTRSRRSAGGRAPATVSGAFRRPGAGCAP